MRTDAFDYELPRELIAQHPAARRDESRLLVLPRDSDRLEHRRFRDLGDYLDPGDLLVLNDTRVVPVRLVGRRETGGWVELLLIGPDGGADGPPPSARAGREPGRHHVWRALVKSRGHLRPGERLHLEGGALGCTLRGRTRDGETLVELDRDVPAVLEALADVGRMPLPPYIKRPRGDDPDREADRERYQTVYAARSGAIAAPTAGLHFTPELLDRLEAKGVRRATVTLHVGLGTFQPVRAERIEDHAMHGEHFELSDAAARAIAHTRAAGRRIVAVGTTATRVLETVARRPALAAAAGRTDLFIAPGFDFRLTDRLITNFHLPRSTLLMLVAALAGRERILAAYEEAKRRRYRFYSYGDAMLIL